MTFIEIYNEHTGAELISLDQVSMITVGVPDATIKKEGQWFPVWGHPSWEQPLGYIREEQIRHIAERFNVIRCPGLNVPTMPPLLEDT